MSYTVTKYPQGTFCWTDLFTTDVAASRTFYETVMRWTSKDLPTDNGPDYTMFYVGDQEVAALAPMAPDMGDMPSHWSCYVSVNNLDNMVQKAESLGATVVMPTMDVMTAGRMAGIQDPTGATLMLWEPKEFIGASLVNTIGAMGWNELYTKDVAKAQEFYGALFDWEFENSDGYTMIKNNGRANGGMIMIQDDWGDFPVSWQVYFTVENLDAALEKARELGGSTLSEPIEASVGRFVMVNDPTGAVCTFIELSADPDHWIE